MSPRELVRTGGLPLSALVLTNDDDALLLNKILESHGFKVSRTSDVNVAEELCKNERFDLAVYSHDVKGALALAGARRPPSHPRVVVGVFPKNEVRQSAATRLHFILRKPLSADLFARILKAAYGPIAADRRASFRLQVNIPLASYTLHHRGEERSLKDGTVVNLSQTGMCVQASEMLPQNGVIEAGLELSEKGVAVPVAGTVIWVHASGRCGIKFAPLALDERRKLEDWLDSMTPQF